MSPHNWWITRTKSMAWTKFCMGRILGNVCHWLVMKQSSIFKAQRSMSSRILCCASERFFNILNQTKLGRTEVQESDPRKATETMMLSMESRLNSSGTSSQDSQRCSSVIKSMIYWATWDKHQKLSQEEFYFVFVLWHLLWQKRQQRWMLGKCQSCESTCEKIWYWTMVIYWTRFWKEVVIFRE